MIYHSYCKYYHYVGFNSSDGSILWIIHYFIFDTLIIMSNNEVVTKMITN